ncbi:YwqJ-related putative deaminase [Streptomyces niveiscabiei]|uniref:YwqJ-related putative deaminase n=1 Tax=Streptomyces niveiscabiei TaxID=164115 RepID=UPI0029BCADD0|nr:YwqJ-related putative deaminase [Streptomyces niveiscabiei]MDX3387742.1 YwqJ-related putative deaminase [Streptomyces niveiscabiei]
MNATQTGPHGTDRNAGDTVHGTSPDVRRTPHASQVPPHRTDGAPHAPADPRAGGDPRVGWSADTPHAPTLRHRRDGILPTVAAALSVRGATLTGTAARGDQPPPLHHLVQDFLDTLPSDRRDRFTGRCAEALLISRHIAAADAARSRRAARKPMTNGEARKVLKQAKLTTRHIREDGDPLHGTFAPPCRACAALTAHFGIRIVETSEE